MRTSPPQAVVPWQLIHAKIVPWKRIQRMDVAARQPMGVLRTLMYATMYRDVGIAAWDCRIAGLTATTAWNRLRAGERLLPDAAAYHGALATVLHDAATAPWAAIQAHPGLVACGLATSKGDPWAFTPAAAATAGPGHVGAAVARALGLGVHVPCATAAACSTGLYTLLAGADRIADGTCTRALVGAVDGSLPDWLHAGFARMGVLCASDTPRAGERADPGTGFIPAPGAGVLALVRGPAAWRLVAGVRLGDAGHETHFVNPSTLTTALASLWAVQPQPDLIVTHLTGTALGDAYELTGLDDGPWRHVPRLILKPLIGHTLGASGAVELALALESTARRIWKLSLGFGGHLAAVAVERS